MRNRAWCISCATLLLALCASCSNTYADANKSVAPALLAGVAYDPKAALEPTTKPIFDVNHPPTGARTFHITYHGANNDTVPGLLTIPGSGTDKDKRFPVVLIVHGLGGRKEDVLLLAVALANRGYATLAIDLAGHGERPLPPGRTSFADFSLEDLRKVGAVSVVDMRRGLDYLQTRSDIAPNRLACIGISLGGILGGVFAGVEPRLACTALWSAGGDWGKLLTESKQPIAIKRRENGGLPDVATVNTTLGEVDPLRYAANIAPHPLLLLEGTNDTVVPPACTEMLYEAAKMPKQIKRYTGGHIPDPITMTVDTLTFLDANLKSP